MTRTAMAALGAAMGLCACSAADAPRTDATTSEGPEVARAQSLAAALTADAPADTDAGTGYEWPAPSGWYVDGFALPPPFAPTLPLAGSEQTEQAPGFADPGAPDFWSYTYLWWVDGDAPIARAALERDLVTYYLGLAAGCADPSLPCDASRFAAHLTSVVAIPGRRDLEVLVGRVDAVDPFFTGAPLTLNLVVTSLACPRAAHRAVLVSASPQPFTSDVWRGVLARQAAFRCR